MWAEIEPTEQCEAGGREIEMKQKTHAQQFHESCSVPGLTRCGSYVAVPRRHQ